MQPFSMATRSITIGEVAQPVAGPGEVLLKVRRTALCGSDTKLWIKGAEFTPGHEIFGVVQQPGHRLDGRRCLVYIRCTATIARPAWPATPRCAASNRCWSAGTGRAAMPNT